MIRAKTVTSPDFIEVYDNVLSIDRCRMLIDRFESSGVARRGETGGGVDASISFDIPLHLHAGWADAQQMLNEAALGGSKRYLRRFAHAVLAPMRLQVPDPTTGAMVPLDAEGIASIDDALLQSIIVALFRPGTINLQKYLADQGGNPYWHCELYPSPQPEQDSLHRVVIWTIYLNDGFGEGETEFLYRQRKIKPKAGSLLIAPTAFTHTHRGNMPKAGNKYIATSWILFRRAEAMRTP